MQLTIEKYTQLVAPLDVRDLDLANVFHTHGPLASMAGELDDDRRKGLDVVSADDDVAESPSLAAA